MNLKPGTEVAVIEGTKQESGMPAEGWVGTILSIDPEDNLCTIVLDAPTLRSLGDDHLTECYEEGSDLFQYGFYAHELTPSVRRDTPRERARAVSEINQRMAQIERVIDPSYEDKLDIWREDYLASSFFQTLLPEHQLHANAIVNNFNAISYEQLDEVICDLTVSMVNEICLQQAPAKAMAEPAFFESYGAVIMSYLAFLGKIGYLRNWRPLQNEVRKIRHKIPAAAADPKNWDESKILGKAAIEAGVDITDKEQLGAFLDNIAQSILEDMSNESV